MIDGPFTIHRVKESGRWLEFIWHDQALMPGSRAILASEFYEHFTIDRDEHRLNYGLVGMVVEFHPGVGWISKLPSRRDANRCVDCNKPVGEQCIPCFTLQENDE